MKTYLKPYYILLFIILCAGVLLRSVAYFSNYTLWLDECSLALNVLNKGFSGFFAKLDYIQSAPPLFMGLTKIVTGILGFNTFSLRLLPFLSSLLALPLFYFFSKKILSNKISVITAFAVFCLNYNLIYYSNEFRFYSVDVFLFILGFLLALKFDIQKMSFKKAFLFGISGFALFLISTPFGFILGAFVILNILKSYKTKENWLKILTFLSPSVLLMPFYLIFTLLPSREAKIMYFKNYFEGGFINLNPLNLLSVLRENLVYFFSQEYFILFGALLFITGFVLVLLNLKSKDEKVFKISLLTLIIFILVLTASYLKIYPIKERIALYLFPFFVVFILKPLDLLSKRRIFLSGFLILSVILFLSSYNLSYFKNIYPEMKAKKGDGAKIMTILKDSFKDGDILVYNDASNTVYQYNAIQAGFSARDFIMIKTLKHNKEWYFSALNSLPEGYTYWFYYPNDYYKTPVIPFLKEWTGDKRVLKEYKGKNSYFAGVKL